MAEFPALPLWTDAFIGDTYHLTPAECGAYIRLLMAAWRSPGCRLPNDDKFLAKIAGDQRRWKRLKPVVMAFWDLDDEQQWYTQKRLTVEHNFVRTKSLKSRASAGARWLKNNNSDHANASPEHMRTACQTDAPTPTPTPIEEKLPNGSSQNAPRSDPLPVKRAWENYNQAAEDLGLPLASKLTEERKRHIRARLAEHGIEGWNEMLYQIAKQDFLTGNSKRGWRATLDWLAKPTNFNKVLDGAYVKQETH